jgi:hypothetical protein
MTKAGRKRAAALVAALVMAGAGRAGAHDDPAATNDQNHTTIVLHVVNFAAIPRDLLNPARDRVAAVYERIGVRIVWVDSEQAVRKHLDGGLHLTVLLLTREKAERKISVEGISEHALGQAHPASGRAYIFCDRVAAMPAVKLFSIQLGAVIAHEVGHLVLPGKSHSRGGIMRAEMDTQQLLLQGFDKSQAESIRRTLTSPAAGAAGR